MAKWHRVEHEDDLFEERLSFHVDDDDIPWAVRLSGTRPIEVEEALSMGAPGGKSTMATIPEESQQVIDAKTTSTEGEYVKADDVQFEVDWGRIFGRDRRLNYFSYHHPRGKHGTVDAVLFGDSWVEGTWDDGVKTWPMVACEKLGWSYVNVASCSSRTWHLDGQVKRAERFIHSRGLRVTDKTTYIIHCGGNDGFELFFNNMLRIALDSCFFTWHWATGRTVPFTFWATVGDELAGQIAATIDDIKKSSLKGRRFLAAPMPMTRAVPVVRAFAVVVSPPFLQLLVINQIQLTVCHRFATTLATRCNDDNVRVVMFDHLNIMNGAVDSVPFVKGIRTFWRHDLFHPTQAMHDIIGRGCVDILRDSYGSSPAFSHDIKAVSRFFHEKLVADADDCAHMTATTKVVRVSFVFMPFIVPLVCLIFSLFLGSAFSLGLGLFIEIFAGVLTTLFPLEKSEDVKVPPRRRSKLEMHFLGSVVDTAKQLVLAVNPVHPSSEECVEARRRLKAAVNVVLFSNKVSSVVSEDARLCSQNSSLDIADGDASSEEEADSAPLAVDPRQLPLELDDLLTVTSIEEMPSVTSMRSEPTKLFLTRRSHRSLTITSVNGESIRDSASLLGSPPGSPFSSPPGSPPGTPFSLPGSVSYSGVANKKDKKKKKRSWRKFGWRKFGWMKSKKLREDALHRDRARSLE